jgi:hypothetical protein
MARANLQPADRPAATNVVDQSAKARREAVIGAVAGLAIGAVGATVRGLAHGDTHVRNLGTDLEIAGSLAVVLAALSWLRS